MDKLNFLQRIWIGKKVISISNGYQHNPEDESISIGEVVDVIPITQAQNPVPIVLFEGSDEPSMCFSTIIEYSDKVYNILKQLSPSDRWDLVLSICHRF